MRTTNLTLRVDDVLQILDALESRAAAWEQTADLLKGVSSDAKGDMDSFNELFIPEECSDASEAEEIARHFRDIIESLNTQLETRHEAEK